MTQDMAYLRDNVALPCDTKIQAKEVQLMFRDLAKDDQALLEMSGAIERQCERHDDGDRNRPS
jgi:hypothetical protein